MTSFMDPGGCEEVVELRILLPPGQDQAEIALTSKLDASVAELKAQVEVWLEIPFEYS